MPSSWTPKEKQRRDRKALSQTHLLLSNQILQDILKKKIVITLWLKLEQSCMTKSLTSKLHLKQQMYPHHITKYTSLEDHLTIFKEIVSDLETMEVKYNEENLGLILLCSLPSSLVNIRKELWW